MAHIQICDQQKPKKKNLIKSNVQYKLVFCEQKCQNTNTNSYAAAICNLTGTGAAQQSSKKFPFVVALLMLCWNFENMQIEGWWKGTAIIENGDSTDGVFLPFKVILRNELLEGD